MIQDHDKSLLINFTNIDFSSELIEEEVRIIYRNLSMRGLGIFLSVENVNDGINKINAIIEEYVDRKDVQGYDKDVLWKLLRTKDPTLFSAIDSYMRNGDLEDFDETMALILKN